MCLKTKDSALPSFNKKADSYDSFANVQTEAAEWLAEWLPKNAKNKNCLELGTGTGLLTKHLIGRFAEIECSDLSKEMLSKCAVKFPELKYRIRDAWKNENMKESWDYLVHSSLLQWASNPIEVLRTWHNWMRPKGKMYGAFFIKPSLPELLKVIKKNDPIIWHSEQTWLRAFKSAGFQVIRFESESRHYSYPSALGFFKSLHETGTTLPKRTQYSEMRRFLKNYAANYRDTRGVYATWTLFRIEAEASEDPG